LRKQFKTICLIAIGIMLSAPIKLAHSSTNPLTFSVHIYSAHIQPRAFEPLNVIVWVNNPQSVGYYYKLRLMFENQADPGEEYDITCTHYIGPNTQMQEETFTVVPWTTGNFSYIVFLSTIDDPYNTITANGTVNVVSGRLDQTLNQLNATLNNQYSELNEVDTRIDSLESSNDALQSQVSQLQKQVTELQNRMQQYQVYLLTLLSVIGIVIGSIALYKSTVRQRKQI